MGNGGSKSTSTVNQKYNTTYVNTTDTNLLNTSVNNFISSTVSNQAKNCSASISQIQSVNIENVNTPYDFVFGGSDQSQSSNMTFDCVQVDKFQNDIANGILAKYMDALENNFSTDILDKLEAKAQTASQNNMGSSGNASTKSTTNTEYTFNSTNTSRTNIENVVKNSIQNNLSMESVQNCISSIKNNQSVNIKNINAGGNVTIGVLSQTQGANLMASCIQSSDTGNKMTNNIASELGLTFNNSNEQTKSTDITSASTAESTNKGVGDAAQQTLTAAGEATKDVLVGAGEASKDLLTGLGSFSSGMTGPCMVLCAICVIFLIIAGIVGAIYYTSQGGQIPGFNNNPPPADVDVSALEGGDFSNSLINLSKIGNALNKIKKIK